MKICFTFTDIEDEADVKLSIFLMYKGSDARENISNVFSQYTHEIKNNIVGKM